MSAQPANEPDKQPRGKFIGPFPKPMAVVACGLSAQLAASKPGMHSNAYFKNKYIPLEKDMERCLAPSEIKQLSVAERILMVQEIWDSIAAEQESLPITEAQKTELDRRIFSYDTSPNEGRSWEEIKRRLKAPK